METLRRVFFSSAVVAILVIGALPTQLLAKDGFHVGGAVRYNFLVQSYETALTTNDVQFTWDTWRINVDGKTDGLLLSFEYRFYPTFGTNFIHHGWVGYNFSDITQMQLGVTQVPFGNLKYASHNWWFVTPYYVGLEDDYDMGIKFTHTPNNWKLSFAYFFQPEPAGPASGTASYGIGGSGRYSYDVIPAPNQSNEERNQLNARATYTLKHGNLGTTDLGASAEFGGIYNSALEEYGNHYAGAIHANSNFGPINIKAQYTYYNYNAKNDSGQSLDIVQMGAYGSGTYDVAAEASMYTLGIAYSVPVNFGPITNIQFYDDYTYTDKTNPSFYDTQQNTLGFLITAGSVYTYVDLASGINHPWLTNSFGTGLGKGVKDAGWNTRFNINMGYYF